MVWVCACVCVQKKTRAQSHGDLLTVNEISALTVAEKYMLRKRTCTAQFESHKMCKRKKLLPLQIFKPTKSTL